MKSFGIYHAAAGQGHKKIAEALYEHIQSSKNPDITAHLKDSLDSLRSIVGKSYPAVYYFMVNHCPWLWGFFYELLDNALIYKLVYPFRSFFNRLNGRLLLRELNEKQPDVLVSTHFLTAELFGRAKREGMLTSKLVTVITDFLPHTFWIHPATDVYCVMSDEGREELICRGVPAEKIHITGIPVSARFSDHYTREKILSDYGLKNDRLTLLLSNGSFGTGSQKKLIDVLSAYQDKIQAYIVCGNDRKLFQELSALQFAFPVKTFGFTDQMPALMASSDLVITKPGGSTACESLAMNLPMILLGSIPGQETRNAKVLLERKVCFKIKDIGCLDRLLASILADRSALEKKKAMIQKLAKPEAARAVLELCLN